MNHDTTVSQATTPAPLVLPLADMHYEIHGASLVPLQTAPVMILGDGSDKARFLANGFFLQEKQNVAWLPQPNCVRFAESNWTKPLSIRYFAEISVDIGSQRHTVWTIGDDRKSLEGFLRLAKDASWFAHVVRLAWFDHDGSYPKLVRSIERRNGVLSDVDITPHVPQGGF